MKLTQQQQKLHVLTNDSQVVYTQLLHGIGRSHSHCTQCTRYPLCTPPDVLSAHLVPLTVGSCLLHFQNEMRIIFTKTSGT